MAHAPGCGRVLTDCDSGGGAAMRPRLSWAVALLALLPAAGGAAPAKNRVPLSTGALLRILGDSPSALAGSLRAALVQSLPPVLYEASPGWGRTAPPPRGLRWTGHSPRNDGTWRKIRVTAPTLADTLVLDLRQVQHPEPGRMTFTLFLSFDARLECEQQRWKAGVRLYGAGVKARLRVKLTLGCEALAWLEPGGALLPDAVFRLRVLRADLAYDNLVVEHVAGVGGTGAQLLGEAVRGSLRRWQPELERGLLARANAAIEKAGDTKEVRAGLGKLFSR